MEAISTRIAEVRKRMRRAALACEREPSEITLLAVSKTFAANVVAEAISAGLRSFGENRVQEAATKIGALSEETVAWHLIGHLQSNKAAVAAELFDMIHSIDSLKLARRVSSACDEIGKTLPVLMQVDLGREPSKFGAGKERLVDLVMEVGRLPGLRIDGLMTLPPFFEEPERVRPFFAELRELSHDLETRSPGCLNRRELSMGMSHDFEVAIQEGSTIVRVGTAIFGARA